MSAVATRGHHPSIVLSTSPKLEAMSTRSYWGSPLKGDSSQCEAALISSIQKIIEILKGLKTEAAPAITTFEDVVKRVQAFHKAVPGERRVSELVTGLIKGLDELPMDALEVLSPESKLSGTADNVSHKIQASIKKILSNHVLKTPFISMEEAFTLT